MKFLRDSWRMAPVGAILLPALCLFLVVTWVLPCKGVSSKQQRPTQSKPKTSAADPYPIEKINGQSWITLVPEWGVSPMKLPARFHMSITGGEPSANALHISEERKQKIHLTAKQSATGKARTVGVGSSSCSYPISIPKNLGIQQHIVTISVEQKAAPYRVRILDSDGRWWLLQITGDLKRAADGGLKVRVVPFKE